MGDEMPDRRLRFPFTKRNCMGRYLPGSIQVRGREEARTIILSLVWKQLTNNGSTTKRNMAIEIDKTSAMSLIAAIKEELKF